MCRVSRVEEEDGSVVSKSLVELSASAGRESARSLPTDSNLSKVFPSNIPIFPEFPNQIFPFLNRSLVIARGLASLK